MTTLYIDGRQADIDSRSNISVSLSVTTLDIADDGRTGYSKSIVIPMTARNRSIMGDCDQIHARERFNASLHTARIEVDGCTVIDGTLMLSGCVGSGTEQYYKVNIVGAGKLWAQQASRTALTALYPDYSATINAATISASWKGDTPVRFLPVQRDKYALTNSSVSLDPAARILWAGDYHPFLHLKSVVRQIFASAGYTVESSFLDSDYFDSFYMSGNYPQRDISALKTRMNFLAGRFSDVQATADKWGRVYADPYSSLNSLGNIVDTADPKEEQDGKSLDHVFNTNDCFTKDGERIAFVPLYEISVGFEYRITYVTDYVIRNRAELTGFNQINLGYGDRHDFVIPNRFEDRRNAFVKNRTYRCIIFDYVAGRTYVLVATVKDAEGNTEDRLILGISARSALVSFSEEDEYVALKMFFMSDAGLQNYEGDWVLYDGYIDEKGSTEVNVRVRSQARRATPTSPCYFDEFWFGGANEGMKLILKEVTTLRPVFLPHPTQGSTVTFPEVAAHGIRQIAVINALRHMFDLCFYTDNLEKKVYVEPRKEFYRKDVTVDWSDRIDRSKPLVVEELGADLHRTMVFKYADGDGATARRNLSEGGVLGRWEATIDNCYATDGEGISENPLFRPSVNTSECLPGALSASFLQVGDRDADLENDSDDFNFPPKVVRFLGMVALPDGQRWGWPSNGTDYPLLAFHFPGTENPYREPDVNPDSSFSGDSETLRKNGFTLCFEDRDGVAGLHPFREDAIACCNRSRRLTVYLRLFPEDIEALSVPNRLRRDFRALYRLRIDGEWGEYRLEEVCDYNPAAQSTKCVFIGNPGIQ